MKDVAFIKDPDGYWIEIVEPARLKGLGRWGVDVRAKERKGLTA